MNTIFTRSLSLKRLSYFGFIDFLKSPAVSVVGAIILLIIHFTLVASYDKVVL